MKNNADKRFENNIAVLTWKINNYGTALQAFALVKFINECCTINCSLLNYSFPEKKLLVQVNRNNLIDYFHKIKNRIYIDLKEKKNKKYVLYYYKSIERQNQRFYNFYQSIPHDNVKVCFDNKLYFDNKYNRIIVGSDQVWSPKYFCDTYFLDFIPKSKRYSYAPSLGVSKLSNQEKMYLHEKVQDFQAVSVRERIGQKMLKELLADKDVTCVVDPTLLFDEKEWDRLLDVCDSKCEDYLLVYTLSTSKWYKSIIEKCKNTMNIKEVKYLTSNDNLFFYHSNPFIITDAGPREFVQLVRNAKFVVTDSFHGLCFSIIYKKQFVCLDRFGNKRGEENSRIISLLESLELQDAFCSRRNFSIKEINYFFVSSLLNSMVERSKNYLFTICGRAGNDTKKNY